MHLHVRLIYTEDCQTARAEVGGNTSISLHDNYVGFCAWFWWYTIVNPSVLGFVVNNIIALICGTRLLFMLSIYYS